MVNVFHLIVIILCCHKAIEKNEQRKVTQIINEEHKRMREYRDKKDSNLEVALPNNKEE